MFSSGSTRVHEYTWVSNLLRRYSGCVPRCSQGIPLCNISIFFLIPFSWKFWLSDCRATWMEFRAFSYFVWQVFWLLLQVQVLPFFGTGWGPRAVPFDRESIASLISLFVKSALSFSWDECLNIDSEASWLFLHSFEISRWWFCGRDESWTLFHILW